MYDQYQAYKTNPTPANREAFAAAILHEEAGLRLVRVIPRLIELDLAEPALRAYLRRVVRGAIVDSYKPVLPPSLGPVQRLNTRVQVRGKLVPIAQTLCDRPGGYHEFKAWVVNAALEHEPDAARAVLDGLRPTRRQRRLLAALRPKLVDRMPDDIDDLYRVIILGENPILRLF